MAAEMRQRPVEGAGAAEAKLPGAHQANGASQAPAKLAEPAGPSAAAAAAAAGAPTRWWHFKTPVIWRNVFYNLLLHSCIPVACQLLAQGRVAWPTLVWTIVGAYLAMMGIIACAHRMCSHRAFKATPAFEVLLLYLQTMAGQDSAFKWAQTHRIHHKYVDTDADPSNIKRGFFFAHIGWLLCEEHPDVTAKRPNIDVSDMEANPRVMFQHRHFWSLSLLINTLLPTLLPYFVWNESLWSSFVFGFALRYTLSLHGIWLVNSVAHSIGEQPYDTLQEARDSPLLIAIGVGPGFHNFHHTFPQDYSESELGYLFNITTFFLDAAAAFGLVYDRRKVNKETVERRKQRTGERPEPLHW